MNPTFRPITSPLLGSQSLKLGGSSGSNNFGSSNNFGGSNSFGSSESPRSSSSDSRGDICDLFDIAPCPNCAGLADRYCCLSPVDLGRLTQTLQTPRRRSPVGERRYSMPTVSLIEGELRMMAFLERLLDE